jgi:hypothetical protein
MAQREISIVLRAKNAMAAGLEKAGKQLKAFGSSAARIGKAFAMSFLAAGTAVAGFAAKALQAFSQQEAAEKQAEAALRAHGEEINNNMAAIKRNAAAIQDETGVADENTIARMARLRMLGVETGQLDAATKATIALKSAGMEEAAAVKAVAMATQGNFDMLNRYIPALRSATTEAEKAAIVNDFVTKGYAQQKDQLDTVAGRWGEFKGRIGDVWEELGAVIGRNATFRDGIAKASEAVKQFGENVKKWVAQGGITNATATFQLFFENVRHGFSNIVNGGKIAFASLMDGAESLGLSRVIGAYIDGIVNQFKAAGKVIIATYKLIRKPGKETFDALMQAAKDSTKASVDAAVNLGKAIFQQNQATTKRTDAAFAERAALAEEHADRVAAIEANHLAKLAGMREEATDEAVAEMEQIAVAAASNAKEIEDIEKQKQDAIKKTADLEKELADKQEEANEKALEDEIKGLEEIMAKRKEIAEKRVADVIAEAKQSKQIEDEKNAEADRAAKLRDKLARGTGISKRDQEFLAAFGKIEKAQQGLDPKGIDAINLANAQENLRLMQEDKRALGDILAELEIANDKQAILSKNLQALLRAG